MPPNAVDAADEMKNLATDNNAFALDLYSRLRGDDGNLFFSPYSISTCLAMVYAGARGDTEAQMARTLHFGTNQARFHAAFGGLQKHLNEVQQKKEIQLNVANGLWGQKSHSFLPAFLGIAEKDYAAKLKQVDFSTRAEPARKEINDWVSDRTHKKIQDLLPPGSLNPDTRLVLVNAIYFKGHWTHQFKTNSTADAPFTIAPGKTLRAPLMNQTANFNYAEADGLQLLELPYIGNDVSMVVLLPKAIDGLKALETSLSGEKLDGWLAEAKSQKVIVFLPRFKMTQSFSLNGTLAGMGMTDAFSSQADFSGMDGARDLFISAIVHKAFVEVNEEGTEAAAATGTMMANSAFRPQPIPIFRADHPFIFLIRDAHSGSILFLGRMVDPTK